MDALSTPYSLKPSKNLRHCCLDINNGSRPIKCKRLDAFTRVFYDIILPQKGGAIIGDI